MLDTMRRFKAGIFQALAHPTRVAVAECLQAGELTVSQLCEKVGVEQANASQHLAVLRHRHVVTTRRDGNQIYYRLSDPAIGRVLQALREFFLAHASELMEVLRQERDALSPGTRPGRRKST